MKRYGEDFTPEQEDRIDEVENAAYEIALVFTELPAEGDGAINEEELPWDMEFVGEIADAVTEIMRAYGCKVRYPFHTVDGEGNDIVCDYLEDDDK